MDPGMTEGEGGSAVTTFLKDNAVTIILAIAVVGMLIYIVRLKKKSKEEFFDEEH